MKRAFYNLLLLMLVVSSCSKEEEFYSNVPGEARLTSVCYSVYGVDSIFYADDKISHISVYKRLNDEMMREYLLKFDYAGDTIKVSSGSNEEDVCVFVFNKSRLSEIDGMNGRLVINFGYENDNLKYLLYKRKTAPDSPYCQTDSISVSYDRRGENIGALDWYRLSYNQSKLLYSFDYTFDKMHNPFEKTLYCLSKSWKSPDELVRYFNSSNILSIGSHLFSYGYDENYRPIYMDVSVYGRTTFHYEMLRMAYHP